MHHTYAPMPREDAERERMYVAQSEMRTPLTTQ